MIGRRAFMTALGLAPIAANKIVEQTFESSMPQGVSGNMPSQEREPTPEEISQSRMRDFLSAKRDIKDRAFYEFQLERAKQMKSWGLPMRQYAFVQDRMARHEKAMREKRHWDMTPEELTEAAIKAGWNKIKSKENDMPLPEGRKPITPDDMAKMHPSTWAEECEQLRAKYDALREVVSRLIEERDRALAWRDKDWQASQENTAVRAENAKLQERVAELEAALRFIAEGKFIFGKLPSEAVQSAIYKAHAALKGKDNE